MKTKTWCSKTCGMQQKHFYEESLQQATFHRKQGKYLINNSILHLKKKKERRTNKLKVNRRKEIIKIRAEINEIEMKYTMKEISESKSWFFEKINKIGKPLSSLKK